MVVQLAPAGGQQRHRAQGVVEADQGLVHVAPQVAAGGVEHMRVGSADLGLVADAQVGGMRRAARGRQCGQGQGKRQRAMRKSR
ncbi:hypothetical protein D3C80_1825050 [compost metagenome]